jgi:arylsulfatase A-like enzyme
MLATLFLPLALLAGAEKTPPNVVVIFTDDMGYGDLSCFGAKKIKTPHLDQLAKDGIRFTDFYVAQAVCSASRAALLTGCYPNRVSIYGALGPAHKVGLAASETTIAAMLKAQGYSTACVGKWHLGHLPDYLPTKRGFDYYYGLPYSNDMWPKHPTAKFPPLPLIEGEKTIVENPDQSRLTTDYTKKAVEFIEKNKEKPFFLYLPHTMPHVPIFVGEERKDKSAGGLYGDVIEEIDWSVGQIVATLAKHGLEKNTLVFFTSDNGPWLNYGDHAGSSGGLREGKGTAWEGGVRVPTIARWPGVIPSGTVCREPAMTIDLLPTIAALCGAKLPTNKIDGKDITPLLRGDKDAKSPQEAYFFWWGQELHAVRAGKWKLHFPHAYRSLKTPANGGKPGVYVQQKTPQVLYDLEADPAESVDLSAKHPEVVKQLEKLGDAARAELGDSLRKVVGSENRNRK